MNKRLYVSVIGLTLMLNNTLYAAEWKKPAIGEYYSLNHLPNGIVASSAKPVVKNLYPCINDHDMLFKYHGWQVLKRNDYDDDQDWLETKTAKMLKGKHSPYLMGVGEVYPHIGYQVEKIDGVTLEQFLNDKSTRLEWNFFCEHWVLGLFKGLKAFQDKTKKLNKKGNPIFAILADRTMINIMVYTSQDKKNIPIHVDFGDIKYGTPCLHSEECNGEFQRTGLLLSLVLNNKVDIPENKKICKEKLDCYLQENTYCEKITEKTLSKIIKDLKKIIE